MVLVNLLIAALFILVVVKIPKLYQWCMSDETLLITILLCTVVVYSLLSIFYLSRACALEGRDAVHTVRV